uniref:Uncharacterized protein n=1 Tax=viral metagenome TaxID=1070528 RepID=A0A6M3MDK4_9ZZZZ
MKKILVAKLDKEDQKKLKEFEKLEEELDVKTACYHSALHSFWGGLRAKYELPNGRTHYFYDNAIYFAEV